MTKFEVAQVIAAIQGLWPRMKWSADEQDLFEEKSERIQIEVKQAESAVRNLKATNPKFPTIADLLKALDNARNKSVVVAGAPKSETCLLSEMAKRNGVPNGSDRVRIILEDWMSWARASKRTRGEVRKDSYQRFRQEMMELAGASEREIDEHWYVIVEHGEQFEPFAGAGEWTPESVRARVKRMFKDATNGG